MNVPPVVLAHQTLMIALIALAKHVAGRLGLPMDMTVASMARELGVNRTSVYEQADRLARALAALVATGPGRPSVGCQPSDEQRCRALELTNRIQAYRLEHLDAVIAYKTRTAYSPSFRRFVLDQLDVWPDSQLAFAEAAGVPVDTLADWVQADRDGLLPPPAERVPVAVPVDASETTRSIMEAFQAWEGSTKSFLAIAARRHGLTSNQVAKVLQVCGAMAPRPRPRFRHRGATKALTPGTMLVTDGKTLDIELTGSGRRIRLNWQGIVDQATGCDTAVVVSDHEDAEAVREALHQSVAFLGGEPPLGLLHDNKPCYQDADLARDLARLDTLDVTATPGRPENKAILEGAFSHFEARVGTIILDDTALDTLIRSGVREILRAYTAATNVVPRIELAGLSRKAALRSARPSAEERAADLEFVRTLKDNHDRRLVSDWRRRIKSASRHLLDHVFARLGIEHLDPYGRLRAYLATFDPDAIRIAAAIVAERLESGEVDAASAHRYLVKVIQNMQESLRLERLGGELLELCHLQAQDWVAEEQAEYERLQAECDPDALATALAERAAWGTLPVAYAFWTAKLIRLLEADHGLIDRVRRFLIRLFEVPEERRLLLLDRLAAVQVGVA